MLIKFRPKLDTCGFNHDSPEVFAMSQWQKKAKSIFYLLYRWIFAAFFIFVLIYSLLSSAGNDTIDYWFIYLTNIGLFICTLYSIYAALFVTLYHFSVILKTLESDSFSYKVFWLLSNVSIVLAFLISIVYWATLYDWNSGKVTAVDLLTHAFNSVAMLVDLMILLHPMYFFHAVYSIGIGILYLLFSVIYYFAGGTDPFGNNYIYSILNWNNPGRTSLIVIGVMVLAIVLHATACLIQFGRVKLHKFLISSKQQTFEVNKPV